jgi:hypothetical protein
MSKPGSPIAGSLFKLSNVPRHFRPLKPQGTDNMGFAHFSSVLVGLRGARCL